MSKELTAKDIKVMGDKHPDFGQSYWGSVEEQDDPVKFNIKETLDIMPGAKIIAEEWVMKTSAAGNDYMQLKKVKVEGGRSVEPKSVSGESASKQDAMHGDIKLALSLLRQIQKTLDGRDSPAPHEDPDGLNEMPLE